MAQEINTPRGSDERSIRSSIRNTINSNVIEPINSNVVVPLKRRKYFFLTILLVIASFVVPFIIIYKFVYNFDSSFTSISGSLIAGEFCYIFALPFARHYLLGGLDFTNKIQNTPMNKILKFFGLIIACVVIAFIIGIIIGVVDGTNLVNDYTIISLAIGGLLVSILGTYISVNTIYSLQQEAIVPYVDRRSSDSVRQSDMARRSNVQGPRPTLQSIPGSIQRPAYYPQADEEPANMFSDDADAGEEYAGEEKYDNLANLPRYGDKPPPEGGVKRRRKRNRNR